MGTKEEIKNSIGFDLGGTSLKFGFGNSREGLLYFDTIYHEEKSLDSLIKTFKEAFEKCKSEFGVRSSEFGNPNTELLTLGIATPGIVDDKNGIILGSTPNLPFLKGLNLKNLLQEITQLPVFIENDANLMTLGEAFYENSKSLLGITIGTGIGTGFVEAQQKPHPFLFPTSTNKKPIGDWHYRGEAEYSELRTQNSELLYSYSLLKGESNLAMEAGHIIVVPNGRLCLCGKKGCLEAYASAESIKRIISEKYPEFKGMSINSILLQKDSNIQKAVLEQLELLAIGIANIIVILNPEVVAIGGGMIENENFDFTYLKNQVLKNLSTDYHKVNIKKAIQGNKAGVIGAIIFSEISNY